MPSGAFLVPSKVTTVVYKTIDNILSTTNPPCLPQQYLTQHARGHFYIVLAQRTEHSIIRFIFVYYVV